MDSRGSSEGRVRSDSPCRKARSDLSGFALTVDVEEWYHTCVVPEYVDPRRRPKLEEELDWLLPELVDLIESCGCRATFFVLGEVAKRHPERIRDLVARGHELASHDNFHWRATDRPIESFRVDLRTSRSILSELTGREILGYRAPEWSLRSIENPRLRVVAEEGFIYDSSLAPYLGAGSYRNRRHAHRVEWRDEVGLLEMPPLTFGGWLRLPAGSWTGRLASAETLIRAARRQARRRGLTVMVVHPWEISGRDTPGELRGWASFIHETGRSGYRERFRRLLEAFEWRSLSEILASAPSGRTASET